MKLNYTKPELAEIFYTPEGFLMVGSVEGLTTAPSAEEDDALILIN